MKRVRVLVAVLAVLAVFSSCQNSKDFEIREGELIKYLGTSTKVKIPSNVTSIGYQAFAENTNITSVIIPASVKSIGERAFFGCTSLTGVSIPTSVSFIRNFSFSDCNGLTSVSLASNVDFGDHTFDGNLAQVYNDKGRSVGTYVRDGDYSWTKQ